MGWIVFCVVLVIIVIAIAFFFFVVWAVGAGFEEKFPMDKYDYLIGIAKHDDNLQLQKDEFIGNAKEIKVLKNTQDIDLFDVKQNINNLIYPNKKYDSIICPDCGKKPFWILGSYTNNYWTTEDNKNNPQLTDREISDILHSRLEIRYYAICPKCAHVVFNYNESIYDREIHKRIKRIRKKTENKIRVESMNDNFKNFTES